MNVESMSRDDWILAGLALAVAICLLFLPWFDVSVSFGPVSVSATSTGAGAPDGWLGVLAVIAAVALIVDLGIERLSPQTQVPALGGSRTDTRFLFASAVALFVSLKFIFHLGHFGDLGYGFWLAAACTVALVITASRARQIPIRVGSTPAAPPSGPPPGAAPAGEGRGSQAPPSEPPPGSGAL